MKRIVLILSLSLIAGIGFAQKKAVKEAKAAMNNNIQEARELIKPALTNDESKDDSETWKVAGDIEYKAFSKEKENEQLKDFTQNGGDEEVMYQGLYNMYAPYVKADELGQIPDVKGKVKNKVRKDISGAFIDAYPFYINGGVYFNDKKDYAKAADFFEMYWKIPELSMFNGSLSSFNTEDSLYHTIKYYAIISAIQADQHERSIELLKKINNETYVPNNTFKESDTYELLASEYLSAKDTTSYINTLKEGATKFPSNTYFTPNLINMYIQVGKAQDAMDYLDQAIKNDPNNACDPYSVKATLYVDKKDYTKAEEIYKQALSLDPKCSRSLEGLGVLYVLEAQDVKEEASKATVRKEQAELDEKASALYEQSLPHLTKYHDIVLATNADLDTQRRILITLQNVYYNLNKADEFALIDAELKKVNEELGY